MPGIPLRRRLLLLTAAAIAPVAVMAGVGLLALARQQAVQAEHVGLELSRSVANAVDTELRLSISVLQALGGSLTLDEPDLDGFAERARRVMTQRPEWAAILLADSGKFGQQALVQLCNLAEIDIVVTDSRLADEQRQAVEQAGCRLLIA